MLVSMTLTLTLTTFERLLVDFTPCCLSEHEALVRLHRVPVVSKETPQRDLHCRRGRPSANVGSHACHESPQALHCHRGLCRDCWLTCCRSGYDGQVMIYVWGGGQRNDIKIHPCRSTRFFFFFFFSRLPNIVGCLIIMHASFDYNLFHSLIQPMDSHRFFSRYILLISDIVIYI